MVDVPGPEKGTPLNQLDKEEVVTGTNEEEVRHRKMEQDAMKAAKRAGERMKRDDGDEFSNIAPV